MDFFEAVQKRRSIRKFTVDPVPSEVITRALEAAVWAPNSSNVQTWDFFWVRTPEVKAKLVQACMNQSAARTAQELIVVTADPKRWKRSLPHLQKWVEEAKAPSVVKLYYHKLIPFTYSWSFLNSFAFLKWLTGRILVWFKPIPNGPHSRGALQLVAVKSAALACENFVLAMTAQGFDTCMMEGFHERKVKRLLHLPFSARVVMVIAVGKAQEKGTWGKPFRIPSELVIHKV